VVDAAAAEAESAMAIHLNIEALLGQAEATSRLVIKQMRDSGIEVEEADQPASDAAAKLTALVQGKRNWFTRTF
jgi:hypothetical protein